MNRERFYVGNVSEKREDLQIVDKLLGFFLAALDLEGKNRTAAVREILVVQLLVRRIGK